MFNNLSDALSNTFKTITGKSVLSENNIKEAMEQVRLALLSADVHYDTVNEFVGEVSRQCLGEKVLKSVKPSEQVVKVVHEELTRLMGTEEAEVNVSGNPAIIMMVGLHGAGKTTTCAKLANYYTGQKKKVLLAACDVYRPAAIDQLEALGQSINVPVFSDRSTPDVVQIAQNAMNTAKSEGKDIVILDMAGRLQIDEDMVQELIRVKERFNPGEILLTADSALGQEAVSVATHFDKALNITGIVLTKLDGDARGGAALSMRKVTGKPIKFITSGEKVSDLEKFRPEGMASRILGMGDIVQLVREAEMHIEEEESARIEEKMRKNTFDLDDFVGQLSMLKKMGGFGRILDFIPGGKAMKDMVNFDEKQVGKIEALISSMTPLEKQQPELINMSRRNRIAKGAGADAADVSQLLKRFQMAREMMGKVTRGEQAFVPGVPGMSATRAKAPSKDDRKKKKKQQKAARKKNKRK
jgi:signal recognition particle subunit SRP54